MTTIAITHDDEDGTLLDGDLRGPEMLAAKGAVKAAGFRWSRNVGWYLPNSRGHSARLAHIDALARTLRELGHEVTVAVSGVRLSVAERERQHAERLTGRQEALDAKAGRKAAESDRLSDAARQISDRIPFGQPVRRATP